uniref:Putative secreted peptide n=1 Tax=Anopheles braziliensis TaxID=58242 RepID=A0A2M3ZR59_9DIPT
MVVLRLMVLSMVVLAMVAMVRQVTATERTARRHVAVQAGPGVGRKVGILQVVVVVVGVVRHARWQRV